MRGHLAAEMVDSFMEIDNPFEKGEHMVVTGSAATYYNWHSGASEVYSYKPPTDLDLILSVPLDVPRNRENISLYQRMMVGTTHAAARHAGFQSAVTMPDRYDTRMMVSKTFTPEEIREALEQERIAGILKQHGMTNPQIDKPFEAKLVVDMMSLDNTIVKTRTFSSHPNAEASLLRREDPSASLAFKMARSFLGDHARDYPKPGDLIDMFNTLHTDGFTNDPALLRVMTVVAMARQIEGGFDFKTRGIEKISGGVECFRRAVEDEYGSTISPELAQNILESWRDVAFVTFPELKDGAPIFRPNEKAFVMNFAWPYSDDPSTSIVPELLQETPEGAAVFAEHPEMAENLRHSTFLHQRITSRQIAPQDIEI